MRYYFILLRRIIEKLNCNEPGLYEATAAKSLEGAMTEQRDIVTTLPVSHLSTKDCRLLLRVECDHPELNDVMHRKPIVDGVLEDRFAEAGEIWQRNHDDLRTSRGVATSVYLSVLLWSLVGIIVWFILPEGTM